MWLMFGLLRFAFQPAGFSSVGENEMRWSELRYKISMDAVAGCAPASNTQAGFNLQAYFIKYGLVVRTLFHNQTLGRLLCAPRCILNFDTDSK